MVVIQLVFIINSEGVSIRIHYHKIIEGRIQLELKTMESRGKTFLWGRRLVPRSNNEAKKPKELQKCILHVE